MFFEVVTQAYLRPISVSRTLRVIQRRDDRATAHINTCRVAWMLRDPTRTGGAKKNAGPLQFLGDRCTGVMAARETRRLVGFGLEWVSVIASLALNLALAVFSALPGTSAGEHRRRETS